MLVSNGSDFQFKDWPHKDKYVEFFLRVKAFYCMFDDSQTPDVCKKFNIKQIVLKRGQRHKDRITSEEFWREFEAFLKKPKFAMDLRK